MNKETKSIYYNYNFSNLYCIYSCQINKNKEEEEKTMPKIKIQVLDNAPLIIKGEAELIDGEGKTIETSSELHLCRCGLSKNKPYCDGSHRDKFESKVRAK